MKKNEIVDALRSIRITGGCREDAAELKSVLDDWSAVRHELRQISMGLADNQSVAAIEAAFDL